MKKIISFISLMFILTGCNQVPSISVQESIIPTESVQESLLPSEETNEQLSTTTFTLDYDYGFHTKNKAALLFSGNNLGFSLLPFINEELYAGDVIDVIHTGTMWTQETYPGYSYIEDGKVIDVILHKAQIIEFTVLAVPGGDYDIVAK